MATGSNDATSSSNPGEVIQFKLFDSSDHWSFLEEIEAPTWADLTLETELMNQDIDDAWFRVSHPIHQMSSRKLKSILHRAAKGKDHSPTKKVPESVSRSRGKHYKSRKWMDNNSGSLVNSEHPIRDLGASTLVGAKHKNGTCGSSTSTVTLSSSCKGTVLDLENKNKGGMRKSHSIAGTSSTGSAMSKYQKPGAKSGVGDSTKARDSKRATFVDRSKTSTFSRASVASNKMVTAQSKITKEEVRQSRSSFAGKSSVGSSSSLGSIIDSATAGKTSTLSRSSVPSNKMVTAESKVKKEEVLQSRSSFAGKSSVGSSSSLGSILDSVTAGKIQKNDSNKESKSKTSTLGGSSKAQVTADKGSTSKDVCKSSSMSATSTLADNNNTRCPIAGKPGKSNLGSSYGLRNKLDLVNGNRMQNYETNKGNRRLKVLDSVPILRQTHNKDRSTVLKHNTVGEIKLASKESKVKILFCSAARKPLSLRSQSRPGVNVPAAKKLVSCSGIENIPPGKAHNVKYVKCNKNSSKNFILHKEKVNEAEEKRKILTTAART